MAPQLTAPANPLIGRSREIEWVTASLRPGKAGLILGPKGVGKTALARTAHDLATAGGLRVAFTARPDDLSAALADLTSALLLGETKNSCRARLGRVLHSLRQEPPTFVLVDNADLVCRSFARALKRMTLETETGILLAARTGPREDTSLLRGLVFAGSNELHLRPLSHAFAEALARRHLRPHDIHLASEIARSSGGIPAAVVEMARRSSDARYRIGGAVSFTLILADLHIENRV